MINTKQLLFFIFTLAILSCNNNNNVIPKDIIPKEKMVAVITDIELTEALIKLKFSNKDSSINQGKLFNEVYQNHNTSEEHFNESIEYYSKQPKVLDSIYVKVIAKLSQIQAENQ